MTVESTTIAWQERSFGATDGVVLGYRVAGPAPAPGPPLMLLHGAASNGTRWWHFAAHSRLRQDRLLLFPDLRGHGASCWRGGAGMERWCDDLAELLDATGQRCALVGGHCLGANIAVHFASRHPRRCAGLVLIEPMLAAALLGPLARLGPLAPALRLARGAVRWANRLGIRRRRLRPLDLQQLDRSVQGAASAAAGEQALRRRYAAPRHDLLTLPTVQYLSDLLEVRRSLPLAGLAVPVLAILSSGRLMAEPAVTRRALAVVPDLEIVELPARHWIPTEQPQALVECIDDWVGRRGHAATAAG